jgi:hypothetical protein
MVHCAIKTVFELFAGGVDSSYTFLKLSGINARLTTKARSFRVELRP